MQITKFNRVDFDTYVKDNAILDKKIFKKNYSMFYDFKNAKKMVEEARAIYEHLSQNITHMAYLDFYFNTIEPKYAYFINNIIGFNKLFDGLLKNLVSDPTNYNTYLRYREIYKTGSIKLLKEAIVESFCCSLPIQCLLLMDKEPNYLDEPIRFFEKLQLKKEYQSFEGMLDILKRFNFKVKTNLPQRWNKNLIFNVLILNNKGVKICG